MLSVPGLGLILDTINSPPTLARSLISGHAFRPVLAICAICTLSAPTVVKRLQDFRQYRPTGKSLSV